MDIATRKSECDYNSFASIRDQFLYGLIIDLHKMKSDEDFVFAPIRDSVIASTSKHHDGMPTAPSWVDDTHSTRQFLFPSAMEDLAARSTSTV
ncbi:unnamed protein product [Protopolystoma xenopodis]|uniref:Uncharacterized protein n=1 Tax=Protopolystoma xenopodis TaxID=117903 RepID=A0A3S5AA36_9PLAT|nr:unnamed protein product [Protopolystoma xenopodis]